MKLFIFYVRLLNKRFAHLTIFILIYRLSNFINSTKNYRADFKFLTNTLNKQATAQQVTCIELFLITIKFGL